MAEKRRLIIVVDKCFKKVDEGFEIFDEIMAKMSEANSDNQREKFQDDLKKEIKKLQRLRDQIKGWQSSPEMKDKEKLTHYRKLIEQRMETFKDIERENKTKPHSKQGLSAEDKLDPKEKEKSETIEWLNSKIRQIQDEIDRTESKLETMTSNEGGRKRGKKDDSKKNDKEKIEELKKHLERVKFHLTNWEVVMRLITNEKLEIKVVLTKLKESIEMYVEALDPNSELNSEDLDPEDIYEELNLSSFIPQLSGFPLSTIEEESKSIGESGVNHRTPPSGSPTSTSGSKDHDDLKQRHQSGSENKTLPTKPISSTPINLIRLNNRISAESSSLSSPPPQTPPPPPIIPYNSIAAGTASTTAAAAAMTVVASAVNVNEPCVENVVVIGSVHQQHIVDKLNQKPSLQTLATNRICAESSSPLLQPSTLVPTILYNSIAAGTASAAAPVPAVSEVNIPDTTNNVGVGTTQQQIVDDLNQKTLRQVLEMGQNAQRSTQPQSMKIDPLLGASPLGLVPITGELEMQLNMLEAALPRYPVPMDSEKGRSYLPKMPYSTPLYYPQIPPPGADSLEYYLRLAPETLFFIFYYMEGTRAQLLAAKALKKLSWRFHTKYLMWFQRHEEPKQITDDYEQGTYVFFDFEKWGQRKKEQFTFEYKYLEDKDFE